MRRIVLRQTTTRLYLQTVTRLSQMPLFRSDILYWECRASSWRTGSRMRKCESLFGAVVRKTTAAGENVGQRVTSSKLVCRTGRSWFRVLCPCLIATNALLLGHFSGCLVNCTTRPGTHSIVSFSAPSNLVAPASPKRISCVTSTRTLPRLSVDK